MLHSLALVRQGNLPAEQLFELGHHLLKANPYKYMRAGIAEDMPTGRDCQLQWIQRAAGKSLENALLFDRNLYYPNSKVCIGYLGSIYTLIGVDNFVLIPRNFYKRFVQRVQKPKFLNFPPQTTFIVKI